MVRIVDLQEVTNLQIDSQDYFVISNLNSTSGTYGTARISAGEFFQYVNAGPGNLSPEEINTAISNINTTISNLTTDDVAEESNLYFTTARARSSISATGSISYNSSTWVISYTQPTNVSTFTNDAGYLTDADTLDSAEAIALINTAYVQARQDYRYSSLTGVPTNVSTFTNDAGYITAADALDSVETIALINTAYVQARQDYQYSSLTGAPTNVSTFTNDAGYVTAADGLDSAEAIALIDSAYVQARVGEVGIDSDAIISLIDSAYVQARQLTYDFLDSAEAIALIDSAYVQARANEVYITGITDPKYVSLTGDSMTGDLWVDGSIYASGNITGFASFSDITLKENVIQIESALDKVLNLTGYTFNYIGNPVRVPGLIAQEVEIQLPEAVYETPGGKKAVHYGNMMGLMVEAIKELKSEIDEIKEKLK